MGLEGGGWGGLSLYPPPLLWMPRPPPLMDSRSVILFLRFTAASTSNLHKHLTLPVADLDEKEKEKALLLVSPIKRTLLFYVLLGPRKGPSHFPSPSSLLLLVRLHHVLSGDAGTPNPVGNLATGAHGFWGHETEALGG